MLKRFIGIGALMGMGIGDIIYKNYDGIPRDPLNHKTTIFITCMICIFLGTRLYEFSKNKDEKWLQANMIILYMLGGLIIIGSIFITSLI
ncbi:hypothetical protein KMW28_10385 [Flammeovirga yaeyamensis]|uniref:Uncharacterized protein n=1 Tax=Flammeovirga yaeyamensis TaxID=367791 RepID=A0AAX1N2J0_9BACT|nr:MULTISPECIES: hypothetical protein [Flammeovirga]ANQ48544.1 hypothetical protein MY04_1167 [Flammeovirga sp. MY04]MBB3696438.1 hypothetical protein [Flammeovirga yaeyamensis]NMF35117.1 hypothetical protein [Flammeovirga yaeyamensis]QWG00063.1 hypothetical protein KMW28_10385 [Flammeovirga yaeyamensis]